MNNTLSEISVEDLHGPWTDFMFKLQGEEGKEWLSAFKQFLKKENPWVDTPHNTISQTEETTLSAFFMRARNETDDSDVRVCLAHLLSYSTPTNSIRAAHTMTLSEFRHTYIPESLIEMCGKVQEHDLENSRTKNIEAMQKAVELLVKVGLWEN